VAQHVGELADQVAGRFELLAVGGDLRERGAVAVGEIVGRGEDPSGRRLRRGRWRRRGDGGVLAEPGGEPCWPTSPGPAPATDPPKRSTAASNTSAAPPSDSATSPTTSPDPYSNPAHSDPDCTPIVKSHIKADSLHARTPGHRQPGGPMAAARLIPGGSAGYAGRGGTVRVPRSRSRPAGHAVLSGCRRG
jgi:hypothetical protein